MKTIVVLTECKLHFVLLITFGFISTYLVTKATSSQTGQFLSKHSYKHQKVYSNKDLKDQRNANEIVIARHKRDIIQLGALLRKETKYNVEKLLDYGNYCGIGSDRAGDGSVIDKCDDCCRTHDNCYDNVMYSNTTDEHPQNIQKNETLDLVKKPRHLNCIPYFLTYRLGNISGNNPYCIIDKEVTPGKTNEISCASKICQCDLQFVHCLRTEPCPLF